MTTSESEAGDALFRVSTGGRQETVSRPFLDRGKWIVPQICDPVVQSTATLRVSVLAGLITLGLIALPPIKDHGNTGKPGPISRTTAPEMMQGKGLNRVPALDEITSSAPPRLQSLVALASTDVKAAGVAETLVKITPLETIEILDAATVRTGSMTVRLAGIVPPEAHENCRRLDGLSVPCQDRARSYLQLLVKGRTLACQPAAGTTAAADGAKEGHCRFGETDIAEQLVRQGWAKAGALPEERIVTAELAARRQKLGIWR